MERKLLHTPEGVRDIYNGECTQKLYIQDKIHNILKLYGYTDIQTPSFEFFDIFNKERGSVASQNMFKLFDREGNTLVLRPDMTPAIARCAAKYFEDESDAVRLCYSGNTFINNSRYQGRLKETTQTGCELIGDSSIEADAEMIAILVESVLSSGLTDFQVEVGHIGYFKGLAMKAGLDSESEAEMRRIIRNKNIFRVGEIIESENIDRNSGEVFYKLPQLFGDVEVLDRAAFLTDNETSLAAVDHLKKLYELLKAYGVEKYVTFDLGMLSELDYYTGIVFKAYTYDVGEPIASGGRYDKLIGQFGKDKASVGFCITVDLLQQAMNRQKVETECGTSPRLIVYDESSVTDAIKLAAFFRKSDVPAVLARSASPDDYDKYEDVLFVDKNLLERYGVQ